MMIKQDPRLRSKASKIANHVFFWTNDKKLSLIQEISDKLEFTGLPSEQPETGPSNPESLTPEQVESQQLVVQLNKIGKKHKIVNEYLGWPKQLDP